jgi:hypothetical protein
MKETTEAKTATLLKLAECMKAKADSMYGVIQAVRLECDGLLSVNDSNRLAEAEQSLLRLAAAAAALRG